MSSGDKTKLNGIATGANKYTHPTSSGNKHIPSGGSSGQILRWSADGTAVWGADNNTTYSPMTGATADAAGTSGLVPAPAAGKQGQFLRGDGTWAMPALVKTANGKVVSLNDSTAYKLQGLKLYGKSVQDGVPTPEAPVEIESAGDGGNVTTYVFGQNLIDPMDAGKWKISNNATFEILGNGKIKITGSRGYSGVKYNIPSDAINLLKGKKCVISRTIDSRTNESAVIIVQLTVNTASGSKYYNAIGSPITIDADTTSATFDVFVNNTSTTLETPNTVVFSNLGIYFGDAAQSWDTYEPMQTLTYPTPNGLPGIPVESGGNYTDAEGQQWYCDIVDLSSGVYLQNVEYINAKDKEWRVNVPWSNSNDNCILAYYVTDAPYVSHVLSNKLKAVAYSSTPERYKEYEITVEKQINTNKSVIYISIPLTAVGEATTEALAAYLESAGIYILVPKAMTTQNIDISLTSDPLTTYKPNTTITTDSDPAAGIEVKYVADTGVDVLLAEKQDKLLGETTQLAGFDEDGNLIAREVLPDDIGAIAEPEEGETGQYLQKTDTGASWSDGPDLSDYAKS